MHEIVIIETPEESVRRFWGGVAPVSAGNYHLCENSIKNIASKEMQTK